MQAHLFATSLPEGNGWSMPCPDHLTPMQRLSTHHTGGWVGLRASQEEYENLTLAGVQTPDHPAHSR
jgi:hypothetical protein